MSALSSLEMLTHKDKYNMLQSPIATDYQQQLSFTYENYRISSGWNGPHHLVPHIPVPPPDHGQFRTDTFFSTSNNRSGQIVPMLDYSYCEICFPHI